MYIVVYVLIICTILYWCICSDCYIVNMFLRLVINKFKKKKKNFDGNIHQLTKSDTFSGTVMMYFFNDILQNEALPKHKEILNGGYPMLVKWSPGDT